ncbi:MAG: FliM/FliN family flagellar motor switch protein [Bryobacterales bacterium]|nr:FliM/FliN family flagellar motor switch protein [Bryobacterales bacterium]
MTALEEIEHLAALPLQIQVELDHKIMTVREILELDTGRVLKMSRSAGENVDLLVEGCLLGYGEIVVIEDTMGLRVTDFVSQE